MKKLKEPNYILSNLFIPLLVLIINCLSLGYFISRILILPSGVNFVFLSRFWKYLLVLAAVIYLIFYISIKKKRGDEFVFKKSIENISAGDILLVLLPLTPVVQYILRNQDILPIKDSLAVFAFFVFLSSLYVYVIPTLLGIVSSIPTMMLSGLAFVFTITSMSLLSQYFSWYENGNLIIQALFFTGTFLVIWLLYHSSNKRILHIFIVGMFFVNTGIHLVHNNNDTNELNLPETENSLLSLVDGKELVFSPNIYLLVYDAYVADEILLSYGIDNSLQEDFLREQGFELYPHTYSVGSETLTTMNSVLNVSTEKYGNERRGVSGDGIIHNILKNYGYKTYGLFTSDYYFRGIQSSYDFSTPESSSPPYMHLVTAILMGEFRFNLGFDFQTREEFLESKKAVLEDVTAEKAFIYIHSDLPNHSQNSGACLFYETNTYRERLMDANTEMREDINSIINNDPGAIIIIAGDHGPYLTKNCISTEGEFDISEISRLDIQDRFGTFLAVKWPTEEYNQYDEITILQDLFPAILSYMHQDEIILESKIEPITNSSERISGASVNNGIIFGGIDDGEALFLSDE